MMLWVLCGFVSGALSDLAFLGGGGNPLGLLLPGIFFGLAVSACLRKGTTHNLIGFIATSTLAYYVAVLTTFALNAYNPLWFSPPTRIDSWTLLLAGIVGALITSIGVHGLLFPLNLKEIISITLSGGLFGIVGWTIGSFYVWGGQNYYARWFVSNICSLLLIWQVGTAFVLGAYVKREKRIQDLRLVG